MTDKDLKAACSSVSQKRPWVRPKVDAAAGYKAEASFSNAGVDYGFYS